MAEDRRRNREHEKVQWKGRRVRRKGEQKQSEEVNVCEHVVSEMAFPIILAIESSGSCNPSHSYP